MNILIILQYILALAATIYTIVTGIKWKESRVAAKIIAVISVIAAVLLGINSTKQLLGEQRQKDIAAIVTTIKSENTIYFPIVSIAHTGTYFILKNDVFSFDPFGELFRVYTKNNTLFFSAIIRDSSGKVIANIHDNECTRYEGDYEFNNDAAGYEIVTKGERDVYFSIDLKGDTAFITGYLFTGKNLGICFTPAVREENGMYMHFYSSKNPNHFFPSHFTRPLFKYPRETHFGEREVSQ